MHQAVVSGRIVRSGKYQSPTFLSYDTDSIEKDATSNSSIVTCASLPQTPFFFSNDLIVNLVELPDNRR
jgi:hypothetical protein